MEIKNHIDEPESADAGSRLQWNQASFKECEDFWKEWDGPKESSEYTEWDRETARADKGEKILDCIQEKENINESITDELLREFWEEWDGPEIHEHMAEQQDQEIAGAESGEKSLDSKFEVLSTYNERLCQTPRDGERGFWDGTRGEAKFISYESEMRELLAEYGTDGVIYQDAVPDFSPFSEAMVEIDHMSPVRQGRGGNFEQADQKCAVQWNQEGRDGRTDWTARDAADYRRTNGLSWHECNDRRTCQMIPAKINDYFGHLGGVAECKKADRQEDLFDE